MAMNMAVEATGPLFDGTAEQALDDFLVEAEQHIGDAGVNLLQQELGHVLQHPTGFYESQIVTDRQRDDLAVTDSKVVYGPWLAGVSSRNQTSRFKGYAHWRRTVDQLEGQAGKLAEQVLPKYLDVMNG